MLPNLPLDLVDEILVRVPTKSLIRFRSICKRWKSLFDDRTFSEKQFDNATKESMSIFNSGERTFVVTCALRKLGICYDVNLCQLNIKNRFHEICHCDGLICCRTRHFELMVWNPCLKQTSFIQIPDNDNVYSFQFAFGCDKKSGGCKYKILVFLRDWYTRGRHCSKCEIVTIYDFMSKCWRILNAKIDFYLRRRQCWVSFKGSSYWVAADEKTSEGIVVRFDFSTEMFGRMSLPFCVYPVTDHHLSMSVKNDRIFILRQITVADNVDIWMTGSVIDGQQVSNWSKLMTIDGNKFDPRSFCLDFFVHDEENKVVVFGYKISTNDYRFCVVEEERFRDVYVERDLNDFIWPVLHNYVPSLVHIP